jgi:hypothetical protein
MLQLLTARLYPDMLAFTRQVQIASDAANRALGALIFSPGHPSVRTMSRALQI